MHPYINKGMQQPISIMQGEYIIRGGGCNAHCVMIIIYYHIRDLTLMSVTLPRE